MSSPVSIRLSPSRPSYTPNPKHNPHPQPEDLHNWHPNTLLNPPHDRFNRSRPHTDPPRDCLSPTPSQSRRPSLHTPKPTRLPRSTSVYRHAPQTHRQRSARPSALPSLTPPDSAPPSRPQSPRLRSAHWDDLDALADSFVQDSPRDPQHRRAAEMPRSASTYHARQPLRRASTHYLRNDDGPIPRRSDDGPIPRRASTRYARNDDGTMPRRASQVVVPPPFELPRGRAAVASGRGGRTGGGSWAAERVERIRELIEGPRGGLERCGRCEVVGRRMGIERIEGVDIRPGGWSYGGFVEGDLDC